MELTGYSSDFVIDAASFGASARAFLAAQTERWPGLWFCGTPATAETATVWQPEADASAAYPDVLTFADGPEMEEFWEEHGYALDERGEGPFSLFYQLRQTPLRARLGADTATTDPDVTASVRGAQLLLPAFYVVSLITPAPPTQDRFSASVLHDFLRAARADAG